MSNFCFDTKYSIKRKSQTPDETGQMSGYNLIGEYSGEPPIAITQKQVGGGNSPKITSSIVGLSYHIRLEPSQFVNCPNIQIGDLVTEKTGLLRTFLIQTKFPVLDPFLPDFLWFYKLECTQQDTLSYKIQ